MQPKVELLKIRDFGEIISDTLMFARQNFKALLKCFFIFCGFFIVGAVLFSVLQQIKMVTEINEGFSGPRTVFGNSNPFRFLGVDYFISILFYIVGYVAMQVSIYSFMVLYKENGNVAPTPVQVWGYFRYYYIKIFFSALLLGIIVLVATCFCLIPGFYLYPILSLVLPIMIFENTSFGYAFNRSFRLIKENWWLTFGAIVVMIIIVYFVSMLLILPASIFNAVNMVTHIGKGMSMSVTAAVITAIASGICHVFYILPIITVALCYLNLTEQLDSTGLISRIGQIGTANADDSLPKEEY